MMKIAPLGNSRPQRAHDHRDRKDDSSPPIPVNEYCEQNQAQDEQIPIESQNEGRAGGDAERELPDSARRSNFFRWYYGSHVDKGSGSPEAEYSTVSTGLPRKNN